MTIRTKGSTSQNSKKLSKGNTFYLKMKVETLFFDSNEKSVIFGLVGGQGKVCKDQLSEKVKIMD